MKTGIFIGLMMAVFATSSTWASGVRTCMNALTLKGQTQTLTTDERVAFLKSCLSGSGGVAESSASQNQSQPSYSQNSSAPAQGRQTSSKSRNSQKGQGDIVFIGKIGIWPFQIGRPDEKDHACYYSTGRDADDAARVLKARLQDSGYASSGNFIVKDEVFCEGSQWWASIVGQGGCSITCGGRSQQEVQRAAYKAYQRLGGGSTDSIDHISWGSINGNSQPEMRPDGCYAEQNTYAPGFASQSEGPAYCGDLKKFYFPSLNR